MSARPAPPLREGDTVALIAPAGPLSDEDIARAVQAVRDLGFVPRLGDHVRKNRGYLAGSDEERAADFNAAARAADVRGIFALRGGYGTMRLLDAIEYDALRADPKAVLGYSDLTALLNAITQRANIVTFHGPVAALSQFTAEETQWLRAAVAAAAPIGELHAPEAKALIPGVARGRLAGGNLSLIAALEGTPYAVDTRGAILLIEDVDEAPYRIDRMLTQLRLSGALQRAAGVIAGGFTNCGDYEQVLRDRLGDLGIPVLLDVPSGHIEQQWTLPIGARTALDASRRTLTFA